MHLAFPLTYAGFMFQCCSLSYIEMIKNKKCDLDVSNPADQAPGQRVISGFWRRLPALFLDLIVLGILFQFLESAGAGKM
jgi:hypothetical protein